MDTTPELFFDANANPMAGIALLFPMMIFPMIGLIILLFSICSEGLRKSIRIGGSLVGIAVMVFSALLSLAMIRESDERAAANAGIRENRTAFIEDRGVRIPDSRWEDLEFPVYEPQEDQRFGIAQGEYKGKVVSVVLAWEDGELKLYSTEGEELKPLDR